MASVEPIHCDTHGSSAAIMGCCHIGVLPLQAIYLVAADSEGPQSAWCDVCEAARLEDRGWHDHADAVANWHWVCEWCLVQAKVLASEVVHVANPATTPERRA